MGGNVGEFQGTSENIESQKRYHQYLFVWQGQILSLLGSGVVQFVLIWWLTIETQSTIILSLGAFISYIPQLIMLPFGGIIADRYDRKKLLIFADSAQAATTLVLIGFFLLGTPKIALVLVINAIRSLFQAIHQPTSSAIIPIMVPKDKLSRINSIDYLFSGLVNVISPIFASFMMNLWSIQQLLWVDIITFLYALLPILLVKIPKPIVAEGEEHSQASHENSFLHDFRSGLNILKGMPKLYSLIFAATLLNFFHNPLYVLLSYFVNVTHLGDEQDMAMISAAFQVGMVLGAIFISLRKSWKHKYGLIALGFLASGIGYMFSLLGKQGDFAWISIGMFIQGAFVPMINTQYITLLQENTPHHAQGRIIGISFFIAGLVSPISTIISGPLAEYFGILPFLIGCGILSFFPLLLFFKKYPEKTPLGDIVKLKDF